MYAMKTSVSVSKLLMLFFNCFGVLSRIC